MFDQIGKTVWKADFDLYGQIKNQEGGREKEEDCPFRFPGQYEDIETGLYYNRFRYYMPHEGIYTQRDPIGLAGGNPSVYGLVKNTLMEADPLGLKSDACASGTGNANWKSGKEFGHTFIRHGAGRKITKKLTGRAASTGQDQGQWLNNQKAANFLESLGEIKKPDILDLPEGLGQVVTPKGDLVPATRVQVVPSDTGFRTAYPII